MYRDFRRQVGTETNVTIYHVIGYSLRIQRPRCNNFITISATTAKYDARVYVRAARPRARSFRSDMCTKVLINSGARQPPAAIVRFVVHGTLAWLYFHVMWMAGSVDWDSIVFPTISEVGKFMSFMLTMWTLVSTYPVHMRPLYNIYQSDILRPFLNNKYTYIYISIGYQHNRKYLFS